MRKTTTKRTPPKDKDYYLHGRERRIRRARWEWPDPQMHPEVNITRYPYQNGWRVMLRSHSDTPGFKSFADSAYGGREESLAAAIAWRDAEYKKRPWKRMGWKLSPDKAGNVIVKPNGHVIAKLIHDGVRCTQSFSIKLYGKASAVQFAELALEIWREEIGKVAKMTRREQEKLAARGGFTTRKSFPLTREQLNLPLDG